MPDSAALRFQTVFGREAEAVVRAPGRINLIGEHVDYLDGWVMPAAIDRHIEGAAAEIPEREIRIWTELAGTDAGAIATVSLDDLQRRGGSDSWMNYLIGVLAMLREAGVEPPGFEIALTADLPTGAGLSSSAALETVTALAVEALTGVAQDPVDRALLCQKAEHEYAGVPCGIMDQLAVGASRAGHALMIDCRDLSLKPVPIPSGLALVVADSRVKHALGDGEYRKRREDCESAAEILGVPTLRDASLDQVQAAAEILGDRLFRRARHAVTEIERVHEFATALENQDFAAIGRLMRAGHESIRDDFEVSCAELDALVEAAYAFGPERGLVGSRMTGGGFGGSTISLVHEEATSAFVEHLGALFADQFDHPASIFTTHAAEGARILDRE
ncbi:MAG: galactokinase [Verrucomicrobiae bacterium]|nr:galactokinase [Verrucomicrobiae bacterium]